MNFILPRTRLRLLSNQNLSIRPALSFSNRFLSTTSIIQNNKEEGNHDSNKIEEWASKEALEALNGFKARYADFLKGEDGKHEPLSSLKRKVDLDQLHLLRLTKASMLPLGLSDVENDGNGKIGLEYEANLQKNEENILMSERESSDEVGKHHIDGRSKIIPGEHLALLLPRVPSSSLGPDGSDTTFNPPGGVFTRRMWAGGYMEWLHTKDAERIKSLRVNDSIVEKTFVEGVELKKSSKGDEMILVGIRKEYESSHLVLIDRRSWIYQRALSPSDAQPQVTAAVNPTPDFASLTPPDGLLFPTLQYQTPANLFRYSALTFNAHAIHLSTPWAQQVEGHQGILVHGPLNLSLLIRKWGRDIAGWHLTENGRFVDERLGRKKQSIKSVHYRAKSPICAEQPYWIGIQPSTSQTEQSEEEQEHTVVAIKPDGKIIMEAKIKSM